MKQSKKAPADKAKGKDQAASIDKVLSRHPLIDKQRLNKATSSNAAQLIQDTRTIQVSSGNSKQSSKSPASSSTSNKVTLIQAGSFESIPLLNLAATTSSNTIKPPAILDFASDTNPGGGWRSSQVGTQEESLCRVSSLGLALENSASTCYPIPHFGAVWVPNVAVVLPEKEDKEEVAFWCAVVAASLRFGGAGEVQDREFIYTKCEGIIKVVVEKGYDTVVLGAWGCGAFGNDAEVVAKGFMRAVIKYQSFGLLKQVVFAVLGVKMVATFERVLSEYQGEVDFEVHAKR